MKIGDWVRARGSISGLPFRVYGKVIGMDESHAEVQFPQETRLVNQIVIKVVDNHKCSPENVGRFLDWMKNRNGIAVWNSANLSYPGTTWSAPVNDKEGNVLTRNGVNSSAGKIIRIITDINDIDVITPKEIKRFHVATRISGNGMNIKVSDGGSRRINNAVAKAAEKYDDAWHEFDYGDYKNAVICVPGETTPLSEWEVNSGSTLQLVKA